MAAEPARDISVGWAGLLRVIRSRSSASRADATLGMTLGISTWNSTP